MEESGRIYLVRHGETEWSRTGQHTGRTNIPLTDEGRRRPAAIARYLAGRAMKVFVSPLDRAKDTCALAGYADGAHVDPDLLEWDYGVYEGRTTAEIRRDDPAWSVWHSPIPGGETLEQVAQRARAMIDRAVGQSGDVALFAHGHILRILAACWIGMPPLTGRYLALDTASVSLLGYERQTRVIRQWNYTPE